MFCSVISAFHVPRFVVAEYDRPISCYSMEVDRIIHGK
jgi:hypothetical protein